MSRRLRGSKIGAEKTGTRSEKDALLNQTKTNHGRELTKMGKIILSHPRSINDDLFLAVALAVYAAEQAEPPPSRPIATII